jgi:ferredoxin
LAVDGIVSLSKLKTHGLTRMTGAIKNQFGCVPGVLKSEFHARLPDVEHFSQMLVDLSRLLRPRLYVMDGIVAMEGNGPRNGDPRPMAALLLSGDPVALDATACRMMNLDPALVPTVTWGQRLGLGTYRQPEIRGDPLESFVVPDFVVNRRRGPTTGRQGWFGSLMRDRVVPRPVLNPATCTCCGICVQLCPVSPKAIDFRDGPGRPPVYEYGDCIRCYCCQETCPERAITIQTPLLGRVIHR